MQETTTETQQTIPDMKFKVTITKETRTETEIDPATSAADAKQQALSKFELADNERIVGVSVKLIGKPEQPNEEKVTEPPLLQEAAKVA